MSNIKITVLQALIWGGSCLLLPPPHPPAKPSSRGGGRALRIKGHHSAKSPLGYFHHDFADPRAPLLAAAPRPVTVTPAPVSFCSSQPTPRVAAGRSRLLRVLPLAPSPFSTSPLIFGNYYLFFFPPSDISDSLVKCKLIRF